MPEHVIMNYIETDAPADCTLVEWRRSQMAAKPRRRRIRLPLMRPGRPALAF